jgi:MFS family permease
MGPAYQIRDVAQHTAFQSSAPVESLSKVYAAHDIVLSATMSISTVIFGLIADQMGVRLVYLIGGGLFIVSSICSFRLHRIKAK